MSTVRTHTTPYTVMAISLQGYEHSENTYTQITPYTIMAISLQGYKNTYTHTT